MRVILLKDVAKIGRRFEVKEVPGGHALNFLIPRKLAEPATEEALRRLNVEQKKKDINTDRHESSFKSVLETLMGTPLSLRVSANEQGHLFKGLHEKDIKDAIVGAGMSIDIKEIVLKEPIKEVGEHTVTLRSGSTEGKITIQVVKI